MAKTIIVKPIITEKSTKLGEKRNTYAFRVLRDANKLEIKKAVQEAYNVQIDAVNTSVTPGKKKVRYTKKGVASGMKSAYKKAYVTLKAGESIDFYGNV